MDRQRLALLLIVIFLFAGLMVYYTIEGFAKYQTYKEFDKAERGSSTLCDPCFDPSCPTPYPGQEECNNPNRIIVPNGTPYLPRGGSSVAGASAPAPAAITPNAAASLAAAADTIKSIVGTSESNMKSADAMPLKGTTQPADPDTVTMSATDFYDYLRPQILKTVTDVMNKAPSKAPPASDVPALKANALANPLPSALGASKQGINSPGVRQGDDYSSCKPFNKDEYIRKDSIPCYACTL